MNSQDGFGSRACNSHHPGSPRRACLVVDLASVALTRGSVNPRLSGWNKQDGLKGRHARISVVTVYHFAGRRPWAWSVDHGWMNSPEGQDSKIGELPKN